MSPSPTSTLSPHLPRFGLAGWAFPHWNTAVYPRPQPPGFHPLGFLSRFFDTVEINTSFYAPLRPEHARLWVRRVENNPRFRFTAKLHRAFTHERAFDDLLIEQVREGLRPLAGARRLGCLLMQFPWSFRFTPENREHFIRLRRLFSSYPLVAEMRHASWMSDEALGTFIDYHVGFVNIDQPDHVGAMPPTAFLTSPVGYVRLHGRNATNWWPQTQTGSRYDYLYSPVELADWKQRIQRIRSFTSEVYVIANNDAGAKSVVNALQLSSMVEGKLKLAPEELMRRYPAELQGFVERPRQEMLFDWGPEIQTQSAA